MRLRTLCHSTPAPNAPPSSRLLVPVLAAAERAAVVPILSRQQRQPYRPLVAHLARQSRPRPCRGPGIAAAAVAAPASSSSTRPCLRSRLSLDAFFAQKKLSRASQPETSPSALRETVRACLARSRPRPQRGKVDPVVSARARERGSARDELALGRARGSAELLTLVLLEARAAKVAGAPRSSVRRRATIATVRVRVRVRVPCALGERTDKVRPQAFERGADVPCVCRAAPPPPPLCAPGSRWVVSVGRKVGRSSATPPNPCPGYLMVRLTRFSKLLRRELVEALRCAGLETDALGKGKWAIARRSCSGGALASVQVRAGQSYAERTCCVRDASTEDRRQASEESM